MVSGGATVVAETGIFAGSAWAWPEKASANAAAEVASKNLRINKELPIAKFNSIAAGIVPAGAEYREHTVVWLRLG